MLHKAPTLSGDTKNNLKHEKYLLDLTKKQGRAVNT